MPVAGALEPGEVAAVLAQWLAPRVGAVGEVVVPEIEVPQGSGFSNATYLLTAEWTGPDGPDRQELVVRSQSAEHNIFLNPDVLREQFRTMELLGPHPQVPVPAMRWAEADPSILGNPFFVMDRLHGNVPADNPPYQREGFVVDMNPEQRREWHVNGVQAMARVGGVDWRSIDGFDYLDRTEYGALGPEQRQGAVEAFFNFADGPGHPVAEPAWTWLQDNWPDDSDRIELCWGDARPGNQMSVGADVIAIFDWEMVSLGNAESDLGWWLFLDLFSSEGMRVERLDGLLDRDETIAVWEAETGRSAANVDFYERLAGLQFSLIMVRVSQALGLGMEIDNPVAALTKELFAR